MDEGGDFRSWCAAAVEGVGLEEARAVPQFAAAVQCFEVWSGLAPDGRPMRRDLDPVRFGGALLPCMTLIEVLDGARDYRWRVAGERALTIIGTRLAGRTLSQIERRLGEAVLFRGALDRVVTEPGPLFYVMRHRSIAGGARRSYGVLLPLRADPDAADPAVGEVSHILGACDWSTGA
jgi:hypothetical protein